MKISIYETTAVWVRMSDYEENQQIKDIDWRNELAAGNTGNCKIAKKEVIRKQVQQETTLSQKIQERWLWCFGNISRMDAARMPYMAIHTTWQGTRNREKIKDALDRHGKVWHWTKTFKDEQSGEADTI